MTATSPLALEPVVKKINKTTVRLIKDDLTALTVDAFVFYAREDLDIGTGYGTAIQMRGGLEVKKALQEIGTIRMGEAVITTAGMMKPKNIIHACGPKHLEPDMEKKLRNCMASALKVAKDSGLKTVAFPPMGTGFYGVPMDMSAKVMLETISAAAKNGTTIEEAIICTVDDRDFNMLKDKVAKMA